MESVPIRGEPVCRKEDCSPFDIGTVYKVIATFPPAQKYHFIKNVWKPDTTFVFPKKAESTNRKRKFQLEWLKEFPWLVYSKYLDGAFCLPCICFGNENGFRNASRSNCKYYLIRVPLTFWTTAKWKLNGHCNGKFQVHSSSILAMKNFLQVHGMPTLITNQHLDKVVPASQGGQNLANIKSIITTAVSAIFCDQSNILLRGNQKDSSNTVLCQVRSHTTQEGNDKNKRPDEKPNLAAVNGEEKLAPIESCVQPATASQVEVGMGSLEFNSPLLKFIKEELGAASLIRAKLLDCKEKSRSELCEIEQLFREQEQKENEEKNRLQQMQTELELLKVSRQRNEERKKILVEELKLIEEETVAMEMRCGELECLITEHTQRKEDLLNDKQNLIRQRVVIKRKVGEYDNALMEISSTVESSKRPKHEPLE